MERGLLCWSNCGIPFPHSSPLTPIFPRPTASAEWGWGEVGVGAEGGRTEAPPSTPAPRLCGAAEGRPAREVQPHRHPQGLPLPLAGVRQLSGLPERWPKSHPQPQRLPKFQQDPGAIWRIPRGGHFSQARHLLHPGAPQWLGTPPSQTQLQQSGPGLGP
ncbi:LOW QUALITY PROTEIN: MYOZ3 isoform 8 [Pongo abelii]|uniref:MYOZ3 isoform 8 n=1 Tax=Pongo abelii TaxID=9601 RepID=A0A2J8X663_PONAB|nr:LOW QUALITY PROTEIN: MYOZ3 isoform 8 [Pongo abelii]